jgi:hypothetical protein
MNVLGPQLEYSNSAQTHGRHALAGRCDKLCHCFYIIILIIILQISDILFLLAAIGALVHQWKFNKKPMKLNKKN